MIILKVVLLILMLLVLPYGAGLFLLFLFRKKEASVKDLFRPSAVMILGYVLVFSLLEVTGIPCVLTFVYDGYTILALFFGTAAFAAGAAGILGAFSEAGHERSAGLSAKDPSFGFSGLLPKKLPARGKAAFLKFSGGEKLLLLLLLLLIGFQLFMSFYFSSNDVDDFYYNAQALSAQEFGTLYRIDAGTGRTVPVDMRHGMALFPIWEAVISTVSGIHSVIIAHRVVPLILIPLSYMLLYEISLLLFPENREQRLLFLLFMNLWRLFGHVSLYTSETFFYTRTWQGKSFAGNFIFPAILWIFLWLYRNREASEKKAAGHVFLSLLVLASGAASSLAVLLSMMAVMIAGALFAIWRKRIREFMIFLSSCVPGLLYVMIYLVN
ncbi:MAG: hypothetical protein K6F53_04690 [Lachnospiraceae bacterium]|nr:hypothetical protein [Lachnospiraceae bacterium]